MLWPGVLLVSVVCSVTGGDPWGLPTTSNSGGKPPALTATIHAGDAAPTSADAACNTGPLTQASPMYRRLHDAAAVLDARAVRQLAACGKVRQPDTPPTPQALKEMVRLWTVDICIGSATRRVEIAQSPTGAVWAVSPTADAEPAAQLLDGTQTLAMFGSWPAYEGGFEAPADNGQLRELAQPYIASGILLDKAGLGERFLRGRSTEIDGADRLLRLERMHARPPKDYSPRNPAGLLVWIDAGDKGPPPACLFQSCDAANVVAVGIDNCGNGRPVANRYQLALDAVATAVRRYHIDPRRVYISGISGGGRVSSIMAACFPDVFAGAVPIVGLSCYAPVTVPGRGRFAPAYAKPEEKYFSMLRKHRLAPITGGRDFNQGEIQAAAQLLRADGVQVKTFEAVDLGHELPKPALFAEALAWADEPYQKLRRDEIAQAERALKVAEGKLGDRKVLNDGDRGAFMKVTEVGPWTPAAWLAMEKLDGKADSPPSPPK